MSSESVARLPEPGYDEHNQGRETHGVDRPPDDDVCCTPPDGVGCDEDRYGNRSDYDRNNQKTPAEFNRFRHQAACFEFDGFNQRHIESPLKLCQSSNIQFAVFKSSLIYRM